MPKHTAKKRAQNKKKKSIVTRIKNAIFKKKTKIKKPKKKKPSTTTRAGRAKRTVTQNIKRDLNRTQREMKAQGL